MKVILLERIRQLGHVGESVTVKGGYARNFLLPRKKALRDTKANRDLFEHQRETLVAENARRRGDAASLAAALASKQITFIVQASENGVLYGSVGPREIVEMLGREEFTLARDQVDLNVPIKSTGLHHVNLILHPDIDTTLIVNIARNEEEAQRQSTPVEDVAKSEEPAVEPTKAEEAPPTLNEKADKDTA